MWYIIQDADGIFLTQTPAETDEIIFSSSVLEEAERALALECSRCD